jgi:hypothetical protein
MLSCLLSAIFISRQSDSANSIPVALYRMQGAILFCMVRNSPSDNGGQKRGDTRNVLPSLTAIQNGKRPVDPWFLPTFCAEYEAYRRQTWALVPLLFQQNAGSPFPISVLDSKAEDHGNAVGDGLAFPFDRRTTQERKTDQPRDTQLPVTAPLKIARLGTLLSRFFPFLSQKSGTAKNRCLPGPTRVAG